MKRSLLLNTDCTPLNFVSSVRAFNLIFNGRAEVMSLGLGLSIWNDKLTTATKSYDVPATIRLLSRVNRRSMIPRFRKHSVFSRDNWQCQYCGVDLTASSRTVDHVIPRCRGGTNSWKNCVASCRRCNSKKGNRSLSESGMNLKKNPIEPRLTHFWEVRNYASWHPDWHAFFDSNDTYRT